MYLNAVEMAVVNSTLKDKNITDGDYNILPSGNACLKYTGTECTDELTVEVKGETPDSGTITITGGAVSAIELVYEEKTIVQNEKGNLVYADEESKYTIGQEVIFNPGDQDRTWNVIDEDATTVTLMLSENLGDTVAWYDYSNYNTEDTSNYGSKDALEYLNSLTTEWDNVDPIKNYTYINNQDGTSKPNGYQKIEIKNGVTKLTHKDGETITDVVGESKARLLTKEEVIEIASKTKANLTEENLRAYIERNLSTANSMFGTSLETVEDGLELAIRLNSWVQYETKYLQTYYTVLGFTNDYGVEASYDISLPRYLYQNLYTDEKPSLPSGYWTLSSNASYSYYAWDVGYGGSVGYDSVSSEYDYGVRPVITVSKSLSLQTVE